jgi:t-SNARE complex subunit (syntaxin)
MFYIFFIINFLFFSLEDNIIVSTNTDQYINIKKTVDTLDDDYFKIKEDLNENIFDDSGDTEYFSYKKKRKIIFWIIVIIIIIVLLIIFFNWFFPKEEISDKTKKNNYLSE